MLTKIEKLRKKTYNSGQSRWIWKYQCDCGNIIEKELISKKREEKENCGCKKTKRSDLIYGKELEKRWNGILSRVINGFPTKDKTKSKCYEKIKICEEWRNDFLTFYNWSLNNGYKPNLHIDRKNSKEDYTPDNCRWITQQENNRNGARTKITKEEAREILFLPFH